MPVAGLLLGGVDFSDFFVVLKEGTTPAPYATIEAAKEAGAVIMSWGAFINTIISFLIIAFAIFLLIRYINKLKRVDAEPEPVAPTVKKCAYCVSDIAVEATRCPNCTSKLSAE